MAKRLYSLAAVEKFLDVAPSYGYNIVQMNDGCLLAGNFILEPTDENYPRWIVIKEVALNEWSSAYTVSQRLKLTKEDQKWWDENIVIWTVHPKNTAM